MRALRTLAAICALVVLAAPVWGRSVGQNALDRGTSQYKEGRYRDALDSFREAVDLDPSLIKAWENVGWAQHRMGNDAEALRIWNTVLKLEPDNVPAWNAVGELRLAKGDWDAAADAFKSSLRLRPGQWDVRLRLGQAQEKLQRTDDAAAQYRLILENRPGDAKATLRLADLEESRGRIAEAEAVLRAGMPHEQGSSGLLAPRLAHILAAAGDASFRAGDFRSSADDYREAAALAPDRALYLVNLGWSERRAGDNAKAIDAWTTALARGATKPDALWRAIGDAHRDDGRSADARDAYARAARAGAGSDSGVALYSLAAIAMDSGDVDGATASLRELLTSGDADESDAAHAAELYIHQGAADAGLALFEELAGDPKRARVTSAGLARLRAAHGSVAYRAGDNGAASAFYRKALEADPRNRAALRDGGWALWRLGDWDGVRRIWNDYAAAYPELAEPHELAGRLELQHGDPRKAIGEAQKALAIDADAKGPEVLLGKAYLADGKFHRARELAERLAAENPDDLRVQTLYAEALWRNLDFAGAKLQWRKVIDMGGDTPRAMHYWLRSTYETGDYVTAIAEANALVARGKAVEPVIRLLAEDALVQEDDAATAHWYRELTKLYPQRIAYWTALANVYEIKEDPRAQALVLERGLALHPDSSVLRLDHAAVERDLGRPKQALREYRALEAQVGRNRSVFEGAIDSLVALGRYHEALTLLRNDSVGYFDAQERALEEASILEEMGRREEAAVIRRRLTSPYDGSVDVPILLYHGIAEQERTLSVPLDRFEGEMQAIHDAGFTTITVSDLDAMLQGRRHFPDKPILVTFDDARGDSFRYADPILTRLGMTATMFVPTVRIADESAFNTDWATLARLARSGRWDFQAHGHLAHDPIPIDGVGGLAEFLVNRQWLTDEQRLETPDEFAARVAGDYATCKELLQANIPGQTVVGYAFPFSEMGQLHGGNEPDALDVNDRTFRSLYRFGFIQDSIGTNRLVPGQNGPLILHRLSVRREWDGERLVSHLMAAAAASRARLAGAQADIANARYRSAERTLRAMIAAEPRTFPEVGVPLAVGLYEQGREREAAQTVADLPSGATWGRPDSARRKLGRDVAWATEPQAGAVTKVVTDSDRRDSFEGLATGRVPFHAPVDLSASFGYVSFKDDTYRNAAGAPQPLALGGTQATLGVEWVGSRSVAAGGWLRNRRLDQGVSALSGQATIRAFVDGHRFGAGCGVTDVETAGALYEDIRRRGCEFSYDVSARRFRSRSRLAYGDLTDGNWVGYGWADATTLLGANRRIEVGGRLELGDSGASSPLYYAPANLVTLFGIVRYGRAFPTGASLDMEAGAGPSHDAGASSRIVGEARLSWTQDWRPQWRTTLAADYGATSGYRRGGLSFLFGYRF